MANINNQETARYLLLGELGGQQVEARVDFDGQDFVGIVDNKEFRGRMSLNPVGNIGAFQTLVINSNGDTYRVGRFLPNNVNGPLSDEFAGRETSVNIKQSRLARVTLAPILN